MPKRNDATLVTDIKIFNRMFPYLMPKRSESLIYYKMEIEMTNALNFIKQKNRDCGEKKFRLFDVVLASLARTFVMRPALNRFIANSEYWQRDEISFNFVVKKDLTEQAPERNAIVKFQPEMTFEEISEIIRNAIDEARHSDESADETTIKYFLKLPKPLLRFAVHRLKRLDEKGRYPRSSGKSTVCMSQHTLRTWAVSTSPTHRCIISMSGERPRCSSPWGRCTGRDCSMIRTMNSSRTPSS